MPPALKAFFATMPIGLKIFAVVMEVVALLLLVQLWRGRDHLVAKLLWSPLLLVPFLGVLTYLVVHDPPQPSDPIDRPPERFDDFNPPRV